MIPGNAPQWLKDAKTEGAIVEVIDGWVIWRGGSFLGGDFRGSFRGGNFLGGNFRGGDFRGVQVTAIRAYSSLYRYQVGAAVTPDGTRWVRMGCLWKTLAQWKAVGIRKSNLVEFPDDGSAASEDRVAAFNFIKSHALRLPLPLNANKSKQPKEASNV